MSLSALPVTLRVIVAIVGVGPFVSAVQGDDFQRVLERHRALLVAGADDDFGEDDPGVRAALDRWTRALQPDGRWPDIDYADPRLAGWDAIEHLRRVRQFAEAEAGAQGSGDAAARREALRRALDHWLAARYTSPNWWHNEIGVPQLMRDILLLLEPTVSERPEGSAWQPEPTRDPLTLDEGRDALPAHPVWAEANLLTPERRAAMLAVIRQVRVQPAGHATNTVWTADVALTLALLTRDAGRADAIMRLIRGEITPSSPAGLQPDHSFHLHGPRLQQFHYGLSFLRDVARLAWLARGTRWEFLPEEVQRLVDASLDGFRWMSRGRATASGTLDRAVSRPGALEGADLREALRWLGDIAVARRDELGDWCEALATGRPAVAGFQAFPRSDFTTYHTKDYSWFLKTLSIRTAPSESINGENLRGALLTCGDHYVVRGPADYAGLPPVWDWALLPGVTWAADAGAVRPRPFTGSIGDGVSGATVMSLSFGSLEEERLAARKLWVCHQGIVLTLIGDLTATGSTSPVRTALDQRRLRGRVTAAWIEGRAAAVALPQPPQRWRWVHHDGIAYVPLGAAELSLGGGDVMGRWSAINVSGPSDPVTDRVFLPVLEHGGAPERQSAAYALFAADTPEAVARRVADPDWTVLRNDRDAQAVRYRDGFLAAVFWTPGCLEVPGHPAIEVDQPCVLIVRDGALRVSDPTHVGRLVTITAAARHTLYCPPGGAASDPVTLVGFAGRAGIRSADVVPTLTSSALESGSSAALPVPGFLP